MENIRKSVETYLRSYPPALELFQKLIQVGDVYLIGGILREYMDHETIKELRDADFIVNVRDKHMWHALLATYQHEKNNFGGYKFCCTGFPVDVWEADKTWAYREDIMKYDKENYLKTLPKTVFLNLDSIIYDLKNDKWYDDLYQEAKKTRVLEVILEKNPYVDLNILRAMVLRRKYRMRYSEKLQQIMRRQWKGDPLYIETLLKIQDNRYHKEIISRHDIITELNMVSHGE